MAGHGHSHAHGHSHGATASSDGRWLAIALALIVGLMAGEVVFGLAAHSLALLSDAAHMLTDAAALALSLVVLRLARTPAAGQRTFGLRRAEILSGQANGAVLGVLGVLVAFQAVLRLVDPPEVGGGTVLVLGAVGVVVNLLAVGALSRANRGSMNVEGSFQHVLTDLFAFLGTLVAGLVVLLTGFDRADPIASLLVAALMLRSASGLLRDSARVLLEVAPDELRPELIGRAMVDLPGVVQVHDLHVWELTPGDPLLSAHVLVEPDQDCHALRRDLAELLSTRFRVAHSTLQVDHATDRGLQLQPSQRAGVRLGG